MSSVFEAYFKLDPSAVVVKKQRTSDPYVGGHPWSLSGDKGLLRRIYAFSHREPLEVRNDSITRDGKQGEHFNPESTPVESPAFVLCGSVGIYRGLWNLKFRAQNRRRFAVVLLGCSAFAYGFRGILLWSIGF